jgi:hypothetical protein
MLTISKNLVWPRDLESFKGGNFNTLSLVDCYVQICNGTAVEHGSLVYQRVSSKEKQAMGDIITSSLRGEQPSQLSSIMPPHRTSRLQLMPPTQNRVAPVARIEWLV